MVVFKDKRVKESNELGRKISQVQTELERLQQHNQAIAPVPPAARPAKRELRVV
jgi:hypothetical protein